VTLLNESADTVHKSSSDILTRNDSKSLLSAVKPLPPSIPENQVVNHDSHFNVTTSLPPPPGVLSTRQRKLSVFTPGFSVNTIDVKSGAVGLEHHAGLMSRRRYSEPFVSGLREFALANSMTNALKHDSIAKAMANFPKVTFQCLETSEHFQKTKCF